MWQKAASLFRHPSSDLDSHLMHASLGPHESALETVSRLVQPFLQGSRTWPTDRQTDHGTPCVGNAYNTVFGSKRSAICAQAVYFPYSMRPSVTWLNSRWWLAACDKVMSALSAVLLTRVWCCRKFRQVSCTECTGQGNDFELISTVKMKITSPVEGYFASEFLAICNHCKVLAAWSRKTLNFFEKLLRFLEKEPITVNFQNSVPKVFIATLMDVLCSNFVKFVRREIGKIVPCLLDKKKQNCAWLFSCRHCADRAQNLPGLTPNNVLRVLQISFKSVYFRRSYSRTREHLQNAP